MEKVKGSEYFPKAFVCVYVYTYIPAPTEMAASLRIPRKLCSILVFFRVVSYIAPPGNGRFDYIRSG